MTALLAHDYTRRVKSLEVLRVTTKSDYILITRLTDIRWLTGFTGSSAVLVAGPDGLLFNTDGRYATQSASEVLNSNILIAESDVLAAALKGLQGRVLYQSDYTSVADYERLFTAHPDIQFTGQASLLVDLRANKEASEIEWIRRALDITELTVGKVSRQIHSGITERELAAEIDHEHARLGSERPSFETIVAFGERSALPHALPTDRRLRNGDVILIDCGCTLNGYASDMTRCFVFGEATPLVAKVHEVVRMAVESAIQSARAGMNTCDLDAIARNEISKAGYGDNFIHSLGHGVGLDIHESPRVGKNVTGVLPENGIITIEPGIYLPGKFGIRIEEMVLLSTESADRLNKSSTSLIRLRA